MSGKNALGQLNHLNKFEMTTQWSRGRLQMNPNMYWKGNYKSEGRGKPPHPRQKRYPSLCTLGT